MSRIIRAAHKFMGRSNVEVHARAKEIRAELPEVGSRAWIFEEVRALLWAALFAAVLIAALS